jgi:hypothetical protein
MTLYLLAVLAAYAAFVATLPIHWLRSHAVARAPAPGRFIGR